jgi:hypothetical protein
MSVFGNTGQREPFRHHDRRSVVRSLNNRIPLFLVVLAVVSFVTAVSTPAHACMTTCYLLYCDDQGCYYVCDGAAGQSGIAPAGNTTVRVLPDHRAIVRIGPYVTPKMDRTYECAVAFAPVPGVARVDHVSLVEEATGWNLPFYSWTSSSAANGQFSDLTRDLASMPTVPSEWQGFFSVVQGGSPGGILHSFVLELTLEEGVTAEELMHNLQEFGILANGSARPDGQLDFGHYHLRVLRDGTMSRAMVRKERSNPSSVDRSQK